ncbi:hypothetical protein [Nocardioides yefusunii]|uniref:TFIIB-type zinc ribbon-containing protein n=1 Tax=Nocardioides yefusunii TaxID=2500546 RepID=A0ABW1QV16_9ACTN|nr:hypothetical protein [Nocardioides yefusunii]
MSTDPTVSGEPGHDPVLAADDPVTDTVVNPGAAEPDPVIDTRNTALHDGVNRCPKCGSTEIQLRVSTQMLICLFCRHEWAEESIDPTISGDGTLDDLSGTTIASGASDITSDEGMASFKCGGCGAEVVVNTSESMSSRCHWCRHVLTVNEQMPNGAVPDAVLPFKVTRDQAVKHISDFAGSRRLFADRTFRKEFTPGNVVGVYLPYMVVDSRATGTVAGKGEIETRRYTRKHGETETTYYDADVYQVERNVTFTVDDLTIESATSRTSDVRVNTNNVINTILPFDTKNAVRWNANYLVGYTSERRDQDVSTMVPVLEDQLLSITRSQVEKSIKKFDRGVRWENEKIDVHGTRWVSMYLPVWLYSYYHEHKGRPMVHYIAVNGRTGETMGSVPVSHGRLLMAALTTGTVLEGIALAIIGATL